MREKVGLFDQSSFAKYEVTGTDAAAALNCIAANDVDKPVGRLTYTQMLNSRGGIECDLTVARLADDRFYIVTGTGFRTHDLAWIAEHIPAGADATLRDVTEDFGTLVLMGPRARDVLAARHDAPMFRTPPSPSATSASSPSRATTSARCASPMSASSAGSCTSRSAATGDVFDALMAAGAPHGIRPVGYRALESLRLEKGYRAWGSDITPNDTPVRGRSRLGREAQIQRRLSSAATLSSRPQGKPLTKRLATFTTDARGRRSTRPRDDPAQRRVRRLSHLRRLRLHHWQADRSRLCAPPGARRRGRYELVVANETVAASIGFEPLYDPQNLKVKA